MARTACGCSPSLSLGEAEPVGASPGRVSAPCTRPSAFPWPPRLGPNQGPGSETGGKALRLNGLDRRGWIRTHGTVTRTTVFEFYDSHAGPCRPVAKRVLSFGIFIAPITSCDAWYRAVMHSWFAIWFANYSRVHVRFRDKSGPTRKRWSMLKACLSSSARGTAPRPPTGAGSAVSTALPP